jgi:alanyl-tRNA synthetase
VGGRGGGKPDMAQAGGKHAEKLPEALDTARKDIAAMLAK